jgi:carboxylate-amine ligase
MYINFNISKPRTIGIELEVQTINPRTGELVNGAGTILSELAGEIMFKPELFNSTLEINTPVCETIKEIEFSLQQNIDRARNVALQNDLQIMFNGCHPFSNWQHQEITKHSRYQNLLRRIQWPVRQFLIFGLHVHIGIDDADKAISIMNKLTWYLPHFIALSSSSPFWNGFDTGLATTRIKIFEELPNAGIPYYFKDWASYSDLVDQLIRTNSIDTVRDIWWDIRPHPIFGTLEIRICDAMPTLKENLAITTLIYLLVIKLEMEYHKISEIPKTPRWILEENKWRAARYGIQGEIILNNGVETRSIKEEIIDLYQELTALSVEQKIDQISEYLEVIPELIDIGPSYFRQRQWALQKPGDYKFIVDNLLKENQENRFFNNSF